MSNIDFVDDGASLNIPSSNQSNIIPVNEDSNVTLDTCAIGTSILNIGGNSTTDCGTDTTTTHNNLQGLQGGDTLNRYHINKDQWQSIIAAHSPSITNPIATINDITGAGVTASNGLTKTNGDIRLGGTLITATNVEISNASLTLISSTNTSGTTSGLGINSLGTSLTHANSTTVAQIAAQNGTVGFGITTGLNARGINIDEANGLVVKDTGGKGLANFDDYEPNFIPRSLVTKQYVDAAITSNTVTASNALTKTGNNIKLGGILTDTTLIQGLGDVGLGFTMYDNATTPTRAGFIGTDQNGSQVASSKYDTQEDYTFLTSTLNSQVAMQYRNASANTGSSISVGNAGMIVTDQNFHKGLVYALDYSVVGITDDRWIPDYGTVKALIPANITASNGLIKTGSNIALGGTFNSDIAITSSTNTFIVNAVNAALLMNGDLAGEYQAIGSAGNAVSMVVKKGSLTSSIGIVATGGIVVTDFVNSSGIQNAGDYEANFVPRSLVTKQYVDSNTIASSTPASITLYKESKWNDFNDFVAQGTYTLVEGKIHIAASTTNILSLNRVTALQKNTISLTYRATNALSDAAGVRLGFLTVNDTAATGFQFWFDEVTRRINLFDIASASSFTATPVLPAYTSGDTITISYANIGLNSGTITVLNVTTGQSISFLKQDKYTNPSAPSGSVNSNYPSVFAQNTLVEYDILNITHTTPYKQGGNWFVGDSIDVGSASTVLPGGYAYILNGQIQAGQGDKSREVVLRLPELVRMKPETVFLKIGTNDTSFITWKANVIKIYNALTDAGINVVFTTPPPMNSTDKTIYKDWLISTFPQVIDIFTLLKDPSTTGYATIYDSGDGVHPNQAGHVLIANTISASAFWHTALYNTTVSAPVLATRLDNTKVVPGWYGIAPIKVRADGRIESIGTSAALTNQALVFNNNGIPATTPAITYNTANNRLTSTGNIQAALYYGTAILNLTSQGTNSIDLFTQSQVNRIARLFNSGNATFGVGATTDAGFGLDILANGIRATGASTILGTLSVGTTTTNNQLVGIGGVLTAASGVSRGLVVSTNLTAAANGDVLIALDLAPTFTPGSFTGTTGLAVRHIGHIMPSTNATYTLGTSGNNYSNVNTRNVTSNLDLILTTGSTGNFQIATASGANMRIWQATGNVLIQTAGTFADAGYKLDVQGTARFTSDVTITTQTVGNNSTLAASTAFVATAVGAYTLKAGDTMTGTLNGQNIAPTTNATYNLGTASLNYFAAYTNAILSNTSLTVTTSSANSITFNVGTGIEKARFSATNGNFLLGTATDAGFKLDVAGTARIAGTVTGTLLTQISGTLTAASALARGLVISTNLTAAANGDVLVGLDLAPTYTAGAFTGVTPVAIRHTGNIQPSGNALYTLGGTGLRYTVGYINQVQAQTSIQTPNIVDNGTGLGFSSSTGTLWGKIFNATGNLLVQTAGTQTDNGYKLDVQGTLRTTGSVSMTSLGSRLLITEGTNSIVGQTTLVAGTKAITITGLTTSSRAIVTLVTPTGTTSTTSYQAVCTANTLTIQANIAAGTINTGDTSVLNYLIIN